MKSKKTLFALSYFSSSSNFNQRINSNRYSYLLKYTLIFLLISISYSSKLWAQSKTVKGAVFDVADKSPMIGVTVIIKGENNGTVTDENGKFSLIYSGDSAVLLFNYLGYTDMQIPVNGQATVDVLMTEDAKGLDEITIVGSRNANRTKIESAVPVDVIDFKPLLESAPQVTVTQILQFIAPSFNSNPTSGGDASAGVNAAQLRGLSVDHTLVLVNGIRRYKSSLVNLGGNGAGSVGTDLNAIPTGAIERIEILRDGASAQYGSDAIAGVINIVLKKNVNELAASATGGVLYLGDGVTTRANANYGINIGKKGFINVTGEFGTRGITSVAGEYQNQIYGPLGGSGAYNAVYTKEMDEQIMASRGLSRKDFNLRSAPHKQQDALTSFNLTMPLHKNTELYAFGGLSYRRTENTGVYRYPGQDRNIPQITPDGYLPQIVMGIFDKSFTAGIKGEVKNWKINFYNSYGHNDFKLRVENSFNVTLGLSSPRTFDAGSFNSSMNLTGLEFTKNFPTVLRGLNLAYGAQYRVETYNVVAGEEASTANYVFRPVFNVDTSGSTQYLNSTGIFAPNGLPPGSQVFPGFSVRDAVKSLRANGAAFIDTELDITDKLMVSAAVRGEAFTDFGNVVTGKIASRYKIASWLGVRASTSTGFRAPDLAQTYFTQVSTNFVAGQAQDVLTASNVSPAARALGIPKLKQERSESYAIGITSQPVSRMELTLDAYQIDVRDRVVITGLFSSASPTIPQDLRDALRATGSTQARFFYNAVNTRTEGIELTANYKLPISKGTLTITAAAVWGRTIIKKVNTPPLLQGQEAVVTSEVEKSRISTQVPQTKYTLMGSYAVGKFNFMARAVYFGKATTATLLGGSNFYFQTFDPITITDISMGYKILPTIQLTIGVNNLFDVYPEKLFSPDPVIQSNISSQGRNVYGTVQNGALGGFAFFRVTANIK